MQRIVFLSLLIVFVFPNRSFAQTSQNSIDVLHYSINLQEIDFETQTIRAATTLTIKPQSAQLSTFYVDLLDFTVDSVLLNNQQIPYSYDKQRITLRPETAWSIEDTLSLRIVYHGHPKQDPEWGGFFFSGNYAYNYGVGMGSEPTAFGRAWYPCHDGFTDRATYSYAITVPKDMTAVACGTLSETTTSKESTTYYWEMIDSIPTYLSAISIGDYELVESEFNSIAARSVPVSLFVPKGRTRAAQGSFAPLNDMLRVFEKYFGAYPWQRVGYVAVPSFSGAMEHATNISIPAFYINGRTDGEMLFAHELAHHWFGNYLTCATEADMWLNEGWATFCEFLYIEEIYGHDKAKRYIRNQQDDLLRTIPHQDGDYLPVWGNPHELTYSSTVYDKGGATAHTLRSYMGDSLFFKSISQLLNSQAFNEITTAQFCDTLSHISGMDLHHFFDAWVYWPGYLHFSIEKMETLPKGNQWQTTVTLRQELLARDTYANHNRVEITFMDSAFSAITRTAEFSGPSGESVFVLPFEPAVAFIDLEEKVADATVDSYHLITQKGMHNFPDSYCHINVNHLTDTAFVRCTHHWIPPDTTHINTSRYLLSPNRFWSVEGIMPQGFSADAKFYFNFTSSVAKGYLDHQLPVSQKKDMIMMYRPDNQSEWIEISETNIGGDYRGFIHVEDVKTGQYALAIKLRLTTEDARRRFGIDRPVQYDDN